MTATQPFEPSRIGRRATVAKLHFSFCWEPIINITPVRSPPIHHSAHFFGLGFTTSVTSCSCQSFRTSLKSSFTRMVFVSSPESFGWDSNPQTTVLVFAKLDVGQHGPHYMYRYRQVEWREYTYRDSYTNAREPVW